MTSPLTLSRSETRDAASPEASTPAASGLRTEDAGAPIWAVLGTRLGDNRMIEATADAAGLPWRAVPLRFNKLGGLQNALPGGSLFSVTRETRGFLRPPWPEVVITSGKRAVPAARWIKAASGGRTRLVHLGRPQSPIDWFDLVLTSPQYGLPALPNVVSYSLPATAAVDRVGEPRTDLEALPSPRLAVVVGGAAPPLALDHRVGLAIAEAALARQRAHGGTLLVVTSPRTSRSAVTALKRRLEEAEGPVRLSAFGEGPNEYRAFLSVADCFLVTNDTASMVTEAAMTGRPVELFSLPERPSLALRLVAAGLAACEGLPLTRLWMTRAIAFGWVTANRDLKSYMANLEGRGLLAGGPRARELAAAELADAGARIRLLAEYVTPANR